MFYFLATLVVMGTVYLLPGTVWSQAVSNRMRSLTNFIFSPQDGVSSWLPLLEQNFRLFLINCFKMLVN